MLLFIVQKRMTIVVLYLQPLSSSLTRWKTYQAEPLGRGTLWQKTYIFKRAEDRRKRLFLGEGYLPKASPMKLAPKSIRRRPLTTIPVLDTPDNFEGCVLRFRQNSNILPKPSPVYAHSGGGKRCIKNDGNTCPSCRIWHLVRTPLHQNNHKQYQPALFYFRGVH